MVQPRNLLNAIAAAVGFGVALFAASGGTQAQSNIKPPQAQAWIDVASYSGFGMPAGGAANPMAAIGSLFGGRADAKNNFGNTQTGSAGRWVDVTLSTRNNPSLGEAQQSVPSGFQPSALKLQAPKEVRAGKVPDSDDAVVEHEVDRPKGKLLLYWGCGATVRPGQPKVLDMSTASAAELANFFVSRRATQRGTHSAPGRPVWPSPVDARLVPINASLVGEHGFSGSGVPEGFRFQIPAAQDLMPALDLKHRDAGGALDLSWLAAATARAYFAVGIAAGAKEEMVIWTSSEVAETGFGLTDYQTNQAVDRWLKDKVLLAPSVTNCTVPKGVFSGEGALLRLIGYGSELNLAHPPRPADPKAPWEPVWAVKVRVKSVSSAVVGMPEMGRTEKSADGQPAPEPQEKKPTAVDLLRGILGR